MSIHEYLFVVRRNIEIAAAAGSDDEDSCSRVDVKSTECQKSCPAI